MQEQAQIEFRTTTWTRTLLFLSLLLFSLACKDSEFDSIHIDGDKEYEIIDPIDGSTIGKVRFNSDKGFVLTRTVPITHPEDKSTANLVVKTIGKRTSNGDMIFLGEQVHSGIWLYDRWGTEVKRYPAIDDDVDHLYPLPNCMKVRMQGDKLEVVRDENENQN